MVQRPRVPQTASPLSPSLLVYCPVTPVLSSTLVGRGLAAGIGEHVRLRGRLLEPARDAHPDHAFLVVVEHDPLAQRRQRRDAVDRARGAVGAEHEPGASLSSVEPSGLCQSLSTVNSPWPAPLFASTIF